MDRATDSGSVGRGFKSLRARYLLSIAKLFVRVDKSYLTAIFCLISSMAELFLYGAAN